MPVLCRRTGNGDDADQCPPDSHANSHGFDGSANGRQAAAPKRSGLPATTSMIICGRFTDRRFARQAIGRATNVSPAHKAKHMLRTLLGAIILVVGTVIGVTAVPTAAADCYIAASGDCVQSPDSSASNVTAICRDGTDSHSETHSGTCSRHSGVAQWRPCGGASSAADTLPGRIASGGDDEFVALAIWPVTGI